VMVITVSAIAFLGANGDVPWIEGKTTTPAGCHSVVRSLGFCRAGTIGKEYLHILRKCLSHPTSQENYGLLQVKAKYADEVNCGDLQDEVKVRQRQAKQTSYRYL
jgi:hypothetical protein